MIYLTRTPAPPLDSAVASIWYIANAPRTFALERVLPSGTAQLIVNLAEDRTRAYDERGVCHSSSGAVLSGPAVRFQIIDTAEQEHVIGVSFRAGGTGAFFREPALALQGPTDVPLDALWGAARVDRLRGALLEAATPTQTIAVMEHALIDAWRGPAAHPAVAYALDVFTRRPDFVTVGAVTHAVGMSTKRFGERFKHDVGLTPKQFCRVRRFQRVLGDAHAAVAIDWSAVAVASGYFDQAHFSHDFRAFSGLTPTGYRAGRTTFQNHVTFLQSPAG